MLHRMASDAERLEAGVTVEQLEEADNIRKRTVTVKDVEEL